MDESKLSPEMLDAGAERFAPESLARAAEDYRRRTGGCTPEEVGEFRGPLAKVRDRTGRTISVKRIDVHYTYDGWGAGNPALASARIRETLRDDLTKEYGVWPPVQVADDLSRPLPGARVFVRMLSYEPVKTGDLSELGLCFFMRRDELDIARILQRASEIAEWDAHAADGEW